MDAVRITIMCLLQ